jgi:hypothetical protein
MIFPSKTKEWSDFRFFKISISLKSDMILYNVFIKSKKRNIPQWEVPILFYSLVTYLKNNYAKSVLSSC